jgi:uncharacterized membrane protein YhaH (DUF805 family)
VQGVGGGLGAALGGLITARAAERNPGAFLSFPGVTMVIFAIALGVAVWSPSLGVVYPAIGVASFMQIFLMGPFFGLTQRLAPLRGRAVATAFIFFILSLTGLGIGPTYVGAMNDYFGRTFGDAEGLRLALTTLVAISTVAGVIAIAGQGYVGKDLAGLADVKALGPAFSLRGRTMRLGLFGYAVLAVLAYGVIAFIAGSFALLLSPAGATPSGLVVLVPRIIAALIALVVFFPAAVRRLNDLGWNGALAILVLVPGVNVLLLLGLLFIPGRTGASPQDASPAQQPA